MAKSGSMERIKNGSIALREIFDCVCRRGGVLYRSERVLAKNWFKHDHLIASGLSGWALTGRASVGFHIACELSDAGFYSCDSRFDSWLFISTRYMV